MPEAGLDLGASGLTPKAAPKTPSTVRASPLQTWASTAKDLQEAQPVDEGVIHAQMRRSFDAGESASKPVEDEAAAPASPSELSAADEPAPAAADLADAFGAAAAPQASPKASAELDSAFGAPQAAADDVTGTPSTDNASPAQHLRARRPCRRRRRGLPPAPCRRGGRTRCPLAPRRRRRRRNSERIPRAAPGRRRGLLGVLGEPRGRLRRGAFTESVRRAHGAVAEGVGRPGRRVWGGVGAPGECRARQRVRRGAGRAHAQESVPPRPHRDERRVQECAFSQARRRVRGRAVAESVRGPRGRVRRPGRGGGGAGGLAGRPSRRRRRRPLPTANAAPRRRRRPPSQSRKSSGARATTRPTSACTISTWRRATASGTSPTRPTSPTSRTARRRRRAVAGGRAVLGSKCVLLVSVFPCAPDGERVVPRLSQQHASF